MKINIDIPDTMVKAIDDKCEAEYFSRSEWIRTALREKLFPLVRIKEIEPSKKGTPAIEPIPEKYKYIVSEVGKGETIPMKTPPKGPMVTVQLPEYLWDDYNLMPVSKVGLPDQFCVTWHSKGERRTVYPIKKFREDGSLELEGNYCKECIKEFLAKDGHLE